MSLTANRPNRLPPAVVARIVELSAAGRTLREVSDLTGVDPTTARKYARRAGVPPADHPNEWVHLLGAFAGQLRAAGWPWPPPVPLPIGVNARVFACLVLMAAGPRTQRELGAGLGMEWCPARGRPLGFRPWLVLKKARLAGFTYRPGGRTVWAITAAGVALLERVLAAGGHADG